MKDFKVEIKQETKKLNKQLGEISNKQGKLVEELD